MAKCQAQWRNVKSIASPQRDGATQNTPGKGLCVPAAHVHRTFVGQGSSLAFFDKGCKRWQGQSPCPTRAGSRLCGNGPTHLYRVCCKTNVINFATGPFLWGSNGFMFCSSLKIRKCIDSIPWWDLSHGAHRGGYQA